MSLSVSQQKVRRSPQPKAVAPRKSNAPANKKEGVGIVMSYVQGQHGSAALVQLSSAKLIPLLETGLPFRELQDLQASLDISSDCLSRMLGISKATFHRSKGAASRLSPAVSDRVIRYARLMGFAVKVFGDLEDAKAWLNAPQFGLSGAVPLEYAKTEIGAREVENLLGRIQYGVYS